MRNILNAIAIMFLSSVMLSSCADRAHEQGSSTPIDSTNTSGTAPATYGGENPASEQDTNYENANDTGTKINMGPVKEDKR